MRKDFKTGGRVGLSKGGGPYLPLRGATGPKQIAKAFRGPSGFKESQALRSKIVKGPANPLRMDQAQRLKAHRLRTKIEKRRAGRKKAAEHGARTSAHYAKYPGAKELYAKQKYAKSFRRKGIR